MSPNKAVFSNTVDIAANNTHFTIKNGFKKILKISRRFLKDYRSEQ